MNQSKRFPAKLGFKSCYGPCDEGELRRWEATLPRGELPEDYRQFLLEWNGGKFDEPGSCEEEIRAIGFSIIGDEEFDGDANDAGIVDELSGFFDPESIYDIRRTSVSHGFRGAVPARYISIGGTNGDTSQPCISVDEDDFGAVYYWGGEPWAEEPTTQFLFPVAANFDDFWKMIQIVTYD